MLVPPRDPTALAEAMIGLLRDRAQATLLGESARRRVEERFDMCIAVSRYEDYYQDILTLVR